MAGAREVLSCLLLFQAILGLTGFKILSKWSRTTRTRGYSPSSISSMHQCPAPGTASRTPQLWAETATDSETPLTPIEIVTKLPEPLPPKLRNRYYMLRHGQSTANVAGIISSARSLAYTDKHGLTKLGYTQGRESASQLLDIIAEDMKEGGGRIEGEEGGEVLLQMVSSPFARAHETALACLDGLRQDEKVADRVQSMGLTIGDTVHLEDGLVERYFGSLDGEPLATYGYIWPEDMKDPTQTGGAYQVESVAAVATRLRRVILQLESKYSNTHLVLVSHADILQICQLYAANADHLGSFSSYRFGNGEVRSMKRTPGSLPEPVPLAPPHPPASPQQQ